MKQVDFSGGSILKNVRDTALPMLAAQLLNLLYNIVDRIYIGRIPGEGTTALGAVGLCFPFITVILAFTNLYGVGGSPLCAIARGRKDTARAEKIMNTSFWLEVWTGAALTILGLVFAEPLLMMFGASEVTLPHALAYMRIYLIGTIFSMIATGMNPYINAQGFPRIGMVTIFIGALLNIILDPVFIFIFHMGVRGAAAATVISQLVSAVFVFVFLARGQAELKLHPHRYMRLDGRIVADTIGLGSVSFIMQFTNALVAVVCNSMLKSFGGDLYISIYTIINSVRQILDLPVHSIGEGSSPVMSYNYGAERYDRVKETIRIVTIAGLVYTAVMWVLVQVTPMTFIRIFSSDESLMPEATRALHLYFFTFVFQALQYSGQTVFKSLNMKKHAIFFSLFRKVIMVVPLTLLLPRVGFGADGVFLAEPVSNLIGGTACFVTMMILVYRGKLSRAGEA